MSSDRSSWGCRGVGNELLNDARVELIGLHGFLRRRAIQYLITLHLMYSCTPEPLRNPG